MAETGGRVQPQSAGPDARQKRWMSVEDALKLAREMLQAGRLDAAEKIAQDVAEARANNADAVHLLGVIAYRRNKLERAIKLVERAIELAPGAASFHANLAEMYRLRGRPELGLAAGERAVSLDPSNVQAWNNLGIIQFDRGDFARSEICYRKAIAGQEDFAHAWNNLGNVLVRLDREEEAHEAFARAISLLPSYSEAMVNDGLSFREEGRLDLAEERLRQAIQANPNNANARVSLAMLRMLQGDIRYGLPEYEWRLALPEIHRANLPGQPWRGEQIEGKRVFVYAEQGLGDVLHYLRFLRPLSMRRPASIVLQVQPGLQRLAELNFPFVNVVRNAPAAETIDVHCALMSLPLLLGFPVATAEAPAAYISAPADQVVEFKEKFAAYPELKVGLVWAGNASHKYDHNRSMSAEYLLPLLKVQGCRFFSLQIGSKAADAQLLKEGVIDLSKDVSNMMSTAGAIAALDLVIAVDTSLAHLAGALGTPVWTLLSYVPDWRWGLAEETTRLYRSMRLFRQPHRRDWPAVIAAVSDALAEKAAARSRV
jgi:tetratricopeptide (TPR) repeat protein